MAQQFLTSMLQKRGPTAFERFMQALVNCPQQQYIAEKLDPVMARSIGATLEAEAADTDNTDAQSLKSDEEVIQEVEALQGCIKFSVSYVVETTGCALLLTSGVDIEGE